MANKKKVKKTVKPPAPTKKKPEKRPVAVKPAAASKTPRRKKPASATPRKTATRTQVKKPVKKQTTKPSPRPDARGKTPLKAVANKTPGSRSKEKLTARTAKTSAALTAKRRPSSPKKKVLVIGSGGREHALAWALARSTNVSKVFCAPGNAGTSDIAQNLAINADDIEALVKFARNEKIDLTLVGPEGPLAAGIVDRFRAAKLPIFGPNKAAARIETSKVFAKEVLLKAGVPTAQAEVFLTAESASRYIDISGAPCVIKADGLACGKGVTVAMSEDEAYEAINEIMVEKRYGAAGDKILIEDYISGEEASVFAITDGQRYALMLPAQDHKRLRDGDDGPNTGGMGSYAPAPIIDAKTMVAVAERIVEPILAELAARGAPFSGLLYAGIIVDFEGPKVLEFNARFGDPETQTILPMLQDDFYDICAGVAAGRLDYQRLNWRPGGAATVVAVSKGYPGPYEKGKIIRGLDEVATLDNVYVFHAGTARDDNKIVTAGGRVLDVTAVGVNVTDSVKRAYDAIGRIKFAGISYRRDIGHKAMVRGRE